MKVVILGGAGFIGSNAAARSLKRGDQVVIVDNLSKPGSERNMEWLNSMGRPEHALVDVRDAAGIDNVFSRHSDANLILHLAGQVAVTTSLRDPRSDFDMNATGTLNVLEAMRCNQIGGTLIFSSTNKVYGGLDDIQVAENGSTYSMPGLPYGISEDRQLDFHSPYGCSKGAADQYVRDYSRIFGLKTVVFRQSCIYGPRQFGVEDQGWVAWFAICASTGRPLTIYGDGKQVRDILYIDDLLDAFDAAHNRIATVAGRIYNVGGGSGNTISLLDLIAFLDAHTGRPMQLEHAPWRSGDQKVFVSDIRAAASDLGWSPKVPIDTGLSTLLEWVGENQEAFTS